MLLAINANNTNFTFALFNAAGSMVAEWRTATSAQRTADEYAVWLSHLMALKGYKLDDITGNIVATVVPQALFNLRLLCRRYLNAEAVVVGDPGVKIGIQALVDRPAEVGSDRLVNAVGAHALFEGAMIVVDFGTATTFDVVDAAGNYRGGAIAPGINLSLEALHMGTAQLPRIAVQRPNRAIGTDTLSCMQSGVFWGYVGLIEGLVQRIRAEWGEPMTVVATGGLAPLFSGVTEAIDHLSAELTMRGLLEIHRLNRDVQA
jgi:type III pantothenate kinase